MSKPRLKMFRVPQSDDLKVQCAGCHFDGPDCMDDANIPCKDERSNFVWINVNWWKGKQDRPVNSESPV